LKAGSQRKLQLTELEELRNDAYDNSRKYKEHMKMVHDQGILRRSFEQVRKFFFTTLGCIFFLAS
jgi:phenylacetate-coenzyme A ligase PaaK-like adenylate-forming protein